MTTRVQPSPSWGAFLVAIVAIVVFVPSLLNGFAYDDVPVIVNDPRVHSLGQLPAILSNGYWGDRSLALYRPLTTLSFAIDWSLADGQAAWFHLTNTLLHGAAAALVFLLLARWFVFPAALAGGLLFAVHPVHVEAVANVVGRAELLAAVTVGGALLLWVHRADDRTRIVRSVGVAALFAAGLASKESAVVLLPLLVLIDVAEGNLHPRRPLPWLRQNASALAAIALVVALWVAVRFAVLGGMAPARVDAAFDLATTPSARILTALQAWPVWANLLFAPVTLLSDYGPRVLLPITRPNTGAILGGVMLLALSVAGIVAALRGAGRTALGLLWFPVTILPVSNLIVPTGVIVAERTLYLPSVAVSIALAAFATRLASAGAMDRPAVPRWAVLAFSLALGMLAGRSLTRIPIWRDTNSMVAAQLADRPDSFRAQWHLAREARNAGNVEEASLRYDRAVEVWPWRQRLNVEAAMYAAENGRLHRAHELAEHAVRLHADDVDAIRILAGTTLDLADTVAARGLVRDGLRLRPDDPVLRRMAAALHMRMESK